MKKDHSFRVRFLAASARHSRCGVSCQLGDWCLIFKECCFMNQQVNVSSKLDDGEAVGCVRGVANRVPSRGGSEC
jgi:hypothetical protein